MAQNNGFTAASTLPWEDETEQHPATASRDVAWAMERNMADVVEAQAELLAERAKDNAALRQLLSEVIQVLHPALLDRALKEDPNAVSNLSLRQWRDMIRMATNSWVTRNSDHNPELEKATAALQAAESRITELTQQLELNEKAAHQALAEAEKYRRLLAASGMPRRQETTPPGQADATAATTDAAADEKQPAKAKLATPKSANKVNITAAAEEALAKAQAKKEQMGTRRKTQEPQLPRRFPVWDSLLPRIQVTYAKFPTTPPTQRVLALEKVQGMRGDGGKGWQRTTAVLSVMAATGVSSRLEVVALASLLLGMKSYSSGSIKRTVKSLIDVGFLKVQNETIYTAPTHFVSMTKMALQLLAIADVEPVLSELDILTRYHGGQAQLNHNCHVIVYALQARMRGYHTVLLPKVKVEGYPNSAPDILIERTGDDHEEERIYVEVEAGHSSYKEEDRNRQRKWGGQVALQGYVAICAASNVEAQNYIDETKDTAPHGRVTSLEFLRSLEKQGDYDSMWLYAW